MSVVHVAVAVIIREGDRFADREILIAKRPDHVHQGGLWEFPGGKVEAEEYVVDALARELDEELGIQIDKADASLRPLIEIHHDYGDKKVFLDVWEVHAFRGEPHGKEGQPVQWVGLSELTQYAFPKANTPILNACRLPRQYAITPEYTTLTDAQDNLRELAHDGLGMILFRQPQLDEVTYLQWAEVLLPMLRDLGVYFFASGGLTLLDKLPFDGVQLPWREAALLEHRDGMQNAIIGVSCHSQDELKKAEDIGADFVTLSPIKNTQSHPGAKSMGWELFRKLTRQAVIPVYGLGGLELEDASKLMDGGAQGIAGIRLWQSS